MTKALPLLFLLACFSRPLLAHEQAPWADKLLSVSLGLDYARSYQSGGDRLVPPLGHAAFSIGLQTLLRPIAMDFKASFDRSFDLAVGYARPLYSDFNGWLVLTGFLAGRGAGREYDRSATNGPGATSNDFHFTFGPALRLEFIGYLAAWSVFLEARQMMVAPVETTIGLGVTISPLAAIQWRERY